MMQRSRISLSLVRRCSNPSRDQNRRPSLGMRNLINPTNAPHALVSHRNPESGWNPFSRITAVAAIILLLGLSAGRAQNSEGALLPEFTPLTAKYHDDVKVLAEARNKALASLRQSYLTVLVAAEQRATIAGKPDEAKAVTEEKEAVTAGRTLATVAPALLPPGLAAPRAYLLRETARAEHEYGVHAQEAAAEYSRGLDFYETKARAAGRTDLLKQIAAEKARLAGQSPAGLRSGHDPSRNLVLNGDFARKNADGTPESWTAGGPGRGAATTEQSMTFLRVVSGDKKETYFLETIDRPSQAHELEATVRLRCRELKEKGEYGLVIAQRDGDNKLVARDVPCILSAASPGWKTLSGLVKILPETKKIVVRCNLANAAMTVDFAGVYVEPR
jgi:hypothetical protein